MNISSKMAKRNAIYIIRDSQISADNFEEAQSAWLDEYHPDKTIIAGEKTGQIIVNEEDTSMIVMEYVDENF